MLLLSRVDRSVRVTQSRKSPHNFKTQSRAISYTRGLCARCSGEFQALGSGGPRGWRCGQTTGEHSHLLVSIPRQGAALPGEAAHGRAAGRRASTVSLVPGTPWSQGTRWLSVSEPRSRADPLPTPRPHRAPTHLGAGPGSRPPCWARRAASQRRSPGFRGQVPPSPGLSGREGLRGLVSRRLPCPAGSPPGAAAAEGSGSSCVGLRPQGRAPRRGAPRGSETAQGPALASLSGWMVANILRSCSVLTFAPGTSFELCYLLL